MAIQKSVIKFKGRVADLVFYQTREGYFVRERGGVDAHRIKYDPVFARARENNAEFATAGRAVKLIRNSLRPLLINTADSRMTGRLTRELIKVIQADRTNIRGQRNVVDGKLPLLIGFDFNKEAKLNSTFLAPFNANIDRSGGNVTVEVPAFVPREMINAPEGATHFRLVSAGAEIDFRNCTHSLSISSSPELMLGPQLETEVSLFNAVTVSGIHPIFIAFGVEFCQHVNGKFYLLQNGAHNSLGLVGVEGEV